MFPPVIGHSNWMY